MVTRENVKSPVFVGLHMKGAEEIAEVFGVKVDTVRKWQRDGAPIIRIGKKFQASYFDLWMWLKDQQGIEDME